MQWEPILLLLPPARRHGRRASAREQRQLRRDDADARPARGEATVAPAAERRRPARRAPRAHRQGPARGDEIQPLIDAGAASATCAASATKRSRLSTDFLRRMLENGRDRTSRRNSNVSAEGIWIAVVAFASTLFGCSGAKAPAGPQGPPEVGVITLATRSVGIVDELPGRTVAYRVAEVRPQVSGIVQKRLFAEGSDVRVGEQLYQIDPVELHRGTALGRGGAATRAGESREGQAASGPVRAAAREQPREPTGLRRRGHGLQRRGGGRRGREGPGRERRGSTSSTARCCRRSQAESAARS